MEAQQRRTMRGKKRFVIALDLGGTKLAGALVDRTGEIVRRISVAVDARSAASPVRQMVEIAEAVANDERRTFAEPSRDERGAGPEEPDGRTAEGWNGNRNKDRLRNSKVEIQSKWDKNEIRKIAAVGVAVPGLVRRDGTVWAPNLQGWTRMPLARKLREAFDVPVVVESDRNAAVLGEAWRGAARGKSDVIVLMIGTGIGAGILSGGRLVRGAHELSGCAGWMTVREEHAGEASRMGQLESLAAGPGIARAAERALARGVESLLSELPVGARVAQEVAEAARLGDMVSIEAFLEAGRYLGYGVANLVSLFDPEVIVIGGGLAKASDLYRDALEKAMKERAQPIAAKKVRVVVSRLSGDANLLGAARVAWEQTETKG
jgi:glucokinase